jgi:Flp pilus assembly protein TadD
MVRESEYNGSAHSNLANLAMLEGRYPEAERELRLAIERDPATLYAWERLGVLALSQGRPRAALDELSQERPKPDHKGITEGLKREARAELQELDAHRVELTSALAAAPGRRDLADSLAAVRKRLAR